MRIINKVIKNVEELKSYIFDSTDEHCPYVIVQNLNDLSVRSVKRTDLIKLSSLDDKALEGGFKLLVPYNTDGCEMFIESYNDILFVIEDAESNAEFDADFDSVHDYFDIKDGCLKVKDNYEGLYRFTGVRSKAEDKLIMQLDEEFSELNGKHLFVVDGKSNAKTYIKQELPSGECVYIISKNTCNCVISLVSGELGKSTSREIVLTGMSLVQFYICDMAQFFKQPVNNSNNVKKTSFF